MPIPENTTAFVYIGLEIAADLSMSWDDDSLVDNVNSDFETIDR